jgi:hypothetical protein
VLGLDDFGGAVVDGCGGVQADAGVAMDVVVVVEEALGEVVGVGPRVELLWELGVVFEGAELCFAVGVVVRGLRARV